MVLTAELVPCIGYDIAIGDNLLDGIAEDLHPIAKASKYVIMYPCLNNPSQYDCACY